MTVHQNISLSLIKAAINMLTLSRDYAEMKALFFFTFIICPSIIKGQDSTGVLGNYSSAGISIDGLPCAKIGMDAIRGGGNAVDAAIAALFCNGLYSPHLCGIGGSMIMTLYKADTGEAKSLVARSMAPWYANENMFEGNPDAAQYGVFAAAIPGQVAGLWDAYTNYGSGNVFWNELIQPSINMARSGIPVGHGLASAIEQKEQEILDDPGLSSIFYNRTSGEFLKENDTYVWNNLADTYERIATLGGDEFYTGDTARNLVSDIGSAGGAMIMQDFTGYYAKWEDAVTVDLGNNHKLYSSQAPSSGPLLSYILNILKSYNISPSDLNVPVVYHRIVEAFKWAYALRTEMGDPDDAAITAFMNDLVANMTSDAYAYDTFTKINDTFTSQDPHYYGANYVVADDHGTSHTSIISSNGDAVAVTSTVNLFFGCKFMSPSTGVIMNNDMDDFSYPNITNYFGVPPSPNNFVKPNKRPLSSMSPAILVDAAKNIPRSVAGGAGGTKITTQTAFALTHNVWMDLDIKRALDQPRFHHQLTPMEVTYEVTAEQSIVDYLRQVGHNTTGANSVATLAGVETNPVDGRIYANADKRGSGGIDGF